MPRGSCRNASARCGRDPVSTVSANGRALSAWKNVRNVPPAGTLTLSRSLCVPEASGAASDDRGHEPERRPGQRILAPPASPCRPTLPTVASPRRATRSRTRGPCPAQVDARRGAEPRRIASERVGGRRRVGRTEQLEGLDGVGHDARRADHGAVGVARADGPDLDVGHRPRGLDPLIGAVDIGQSGPSSTIVAPAIGWAVTMSAWRISPARVRLLLLRQPGHQQGRKARGMRGGHAGTLRDLVARVPERHRAVRDAGRHDVGLGRPRRRAR